MLWKQPFYTLFGVLLTGWTGWMQYTGTGYTSVNQVKQVPKSVRDNPGAYRSHYAFFPRYVGGK